MKIKRLQPEQLPFNDLIVGSYRGQRDVLSMTRGQVLTLQFSKLLNYFPDQLDPEWGGGLGPLDRERLLRCRSSFEKAVLLTGGPCWLRRVSPHGKWGPDNWKLSDTPAKEFGSPFEPYLTANGAVLCINQAKRILGVDSLWLISLKLRLLLDELVILECVKKLLRPPPMWARHEESVRGIVAQHQPPTTKSVGAIS